MLMSFGEQGYAISDRVQARGEKEERKLEDGMEPEPSK